MIGLEMMSVLQMSFLALLPLDYESAVMESLPYLKYSVGANPLFQDFTSYCSPRFLRLGYRCQFLSDYNATVLTLLVCLLAGTGMYIYHRIRVRSGKDIEGLRKARVANLLHVFSDCTLALALFNIYGIVFAFTLNILW